MDTLEKHLCIVIERHSKKGLAEYTIEAADWYYARNIAVNKFREEHNPPKDLDWCVDSMKLDE
jgi:hypothetical protein